MVSWFFMFSWFSNVTFGRRSYWTSPFHVPLRGILDYKDGKFACLYFENLELFARFSCFHNFHIVIFFTGSLTSFHELSFSQVFSFKHFSFFNAVRRFVGVFPHFHQAPFQASDRRPCRIWCGAGVFPNFHSSSTGRQYWKQRCLATWWWVGVFTNFLHIGRLWVKKKTSKVRRPVRGFHKFSPHF